MRKRLLATLLALCMVLTLLPGVALAAESDEAITYPATGGNIYFDEATGTISNPTDPDGIQDTVQTRNYKVISLHDSSNTEIDFSYAVPTSGVTMLIFFRAESCSNSVYTLKSIAQSSWVENSHLSIMLVETTVASKEVVQSFVDENLGTNQIYFFDILYRPHPSNSPPANSPHYLQFQYTKLVYDSYSVAWPFVMLITEHQARNYIRFSDMGMRDAAYYGNALSVLLGTVDYTDTVNVTVAGTQYYNYAADVVESVNSYRSQNGQASLTWNKTLTEYAMQRAAEIALYYDHIRPNGESYNSIFDSQYGSYAWIGENIAWGQTGVIEVMNAWMNSEGHRANILDADYTQIGVGCFTSRNTTYWVQLFGDSKTNTAEINSGDVKQANVIVSTLASHLNTHLTTPDASLTISSGETAAVYFANTNSQSRHDTLLVPIVPDVKDKDNSNLTIATASVSTDGTVTLSPQATGTGTVYFQAYEGDTNPATILLNVKDIATPPAPAQTYTVTVNGGTGSGRYEAGKTVTIKAIVPEGQQFTGWTVDEGNVTLANPDSEKTTFTMLANNVTVTATYEDIATPPAPAQTYTVTVNGGTGGDDYKAGETVTIRAIVPEGQQFTGWIVDEGGVMLADPYSEATTFTMPEGNVTVTATYEDIATLPAPARTYTVTVNGGTGGGDYEIGKDVTITAIVPEGKQFRFWTVDEGDVTLANPYSEVTTFIMPASDVTVTATYKDAAIPPVSSTYTIIFEANGGIVTPTTMTTGEDGRLTKLPIPIRNGYTFDGWFTAPYGGVKITVNRIFTEDTWVYAHWTYNSIKNPGGSTWYPSHGSTNTPPLTAPETYPVTSPVLFGGAITISPANAKKGDIVTVTVTPYDGYELAFLTATDSDGNVLELAGTADGRYTFIMPDSAVTVSAVFRLMEQQPAAPAVLDWVNSFTDVPMSAWYYDAVKFVNENGLMNGLSGTVFAPDANLSRAQLAQILYNKEGKPAVNGGSAFTDVGAGAWYADAVTWAAANHIVGGYGNGVFGPDDNITREQLAVMLWRYAGEPTANSALTFSDADQISDFAQTAICWAVENDILNGKGNNILDPKGFATRAEVAQMLKNYLDNKL